MQNLPNVPFNQLINPAMAFDANNPPSLPHGLQVGRDIAPMLGAIAGLLAQEFTVSATSQSSHPGRVIAFNILGTNYFQNGEFATLLQFTCDLIMLKALQSRAHPTNIIPQVVSEVASIKTSEYIVAYWNAGLCQVMPVDMYNVALEGARMGQRYMQMLNEMQMTANGSFGSGGYNRMAQAPTTGWGNPTQPGPIASQFADRYAGGLNGGNNSLYNRSGPAAMVDNNSTRFQVSTTATEVAPVKTQVIVAAEPETTDIDELFDEPLVWVPSSRQRYRLAYDPKRFTKIITVVAGDVIERLEPVNEQAHALPGTPSASSIDEPVKVSGATVINNALDTDPVVVSSAVSEVDKPDSPLFDDTSVVIEKGWNLEYGVKQAVMASAVNRLRYYKNDNAPAVFVSLAEVISVIPTAGNFEKMLSEIFAIEDLYDMSDKMHDCREKKLMPVQLWNAVNDRMTEITMAIVGKRIGLTCKIESFADDFPALANYIREENGQALYDVFAANVFRNIRLGISLPNREEDGSHAVYDNVLGDLLRCDVVGQKERDSVTCFAQGVAIAHLRCGMDEIGLEFDENRPALLCPEATPAMHRVAETMFSEKLFDATMIERNLVRLEDGTLLELFAGVFGTNTWLVAKAD